ncbi:hypothetical protein KIN20_008685 [Parelaphostrongylus tenuis]|uniref:Globin domain-containing protein n=1 Tax=Parelaphostrongylus tenuis TaxID=148309 RepID=A0AAD5QJ29_PARTN|nr:hypothetical protein KIN20_008685 [Parelaphostrongylus tenuis]
MELASEQIRLLMMHGWLFGSNATVASERINLAWDEDTAGKSTVPNLTSCVHVLRRRRELDLIMCDTRPRNESTKILEMGAESSKNEPSLVEKRYKVERPRTRRKAPQVPKLQVEDDSGDEEKVSEVLTSDDNVTTHIREIPTPTSETGNDLSSSQSKKHFLSKRDRRLLEQSWRKTRKTGAEHIGSKIFLMILTAQPDIKAIFGMEKIPQGRLKYDPRFRQHAVVFTKTFDFVIKNIDYTDKLEAHFESLGRRHVAMQGRGFDPVYWETFAECMTQAAVEWEGNRQRPTLGAWRTLISTIIMLMRRGFDEENNKRKLHSYRCRSPRRDDSARQNVSSGGLFY